MLESLVGHTSKEKADSLHALLSSATRQTPLQLTMTKYSVTVALYVTDTDLFGVHLENMFFPHVGYCSTAATGALVRPLVHHVCGGVVSHRK